MGPYTDYDDGDKYVDYEKLRLNEQAEKSSLTIKYKNAPKA
jgi:hypothetical protein